MSLERRGEYLWMEWDGSDCPLTASVVFFTEEFVDVTNDTVLGGLVSAVQRSGVIDSLGDVHRSLDLQNVFHSYFGMVDGVDEYYICDHEGWTEHGDMVEIPLAGTWVGIYV